MGLSFLFKKNTNMYYICISHKIRPLKNNLSLQIIFLKKKYRSEALLCGKI